VPVTIERLRYYEGEFLRSFDWTAEQTYHLEMRRRLHMAMNLWGIAEGLNITTDTEGSVSTFSISPGVAIDAFGREIFIFNPYQLDDSLVTNNLITAAKDYQLLVRYKVASGTPPSAGYGQCNGSNQSTRIQESFEVLLWPLSQNLPTPEPEPTDALSENAKVDGWAVPIGKVTVGPGPDGKTLIILNAVEANRKYIGVRAQRIISPEDATAKFDVTAPQTADDPPASVEVSSNLYVPQNLVVGKNFGLTLSSGSPKPTGNVKVAGDLFLQGGMFLLDTVSGKWVSAPDFVSSLQGGLAQLLPVTLAGQTTTIDIPLNSTTDVTSGTSSPTIQVPTTFLPGKFTAQVTASISGVIWRDKQTVDKVRALLAVGDTDTSFQITANPSVSGQVLNLNFTWTIAPVKQMMVGPTNVFVSAIGSIIVSYTVLFTPKP
jgi:hypothetical protein